MKLTKLLLFGIFFATLGTAHAQGLTKEEAQALFGKSGCLACHNIDKDVIGPAYVKVSARYANPDEATKAYLKGAAPIDYLLIKVRKGSIAGGGKNWIKNDKGAPYGVMTPNPITKVSDEDLKKLVTFILGLNASAPATAATAPAKTGT